MNRQNLPYRKNCEGYFLYKNDLVLARDTKIGYIEFPGGGVDKEETPKQAVIRETFEETGAKLSQVKLVDKLYIDWDKNWAKSEKQKKRYKIYRGEEMYFFVGKVTNISEPEGDLKNDDPAWQANPLMQIEDVLENIKKEICTSGSLEKYHQNQLYYVSKLKNYLNFQSLKHVRTNTTICP